MYNIQHLRHTQFPNSANYIYFNHASISPLPTRSKEKMVVAIEKLAENPSNFWMTDGMEALAALKQEVMALIHAGAEQEIVPVTTTAAAINAIAQSIAWRPRDNLLFCEVEFPANAYPWMSLQRDGVEVRQVPAVNGGLTMEALRPLVDKNTRLIAASAIQFFSGHRSDLATIGAFCRERGILFVVDAIQAIGHMPIDVQTMNIDVLATGGQKSLLAPPGIGFMYVRDAVAETLNPRIIGGNATKDFLHWLAYDLTLLPGAQRFSMGTGNLVGLIGMLESVRFLQELGIAQIDTHTQGLTAVASHHLTQLGYHVITPTQPQQYGPITTFATGLSLEKTDALVNYLKEQQINVVKHLDAPGNPYIRLSFHCYNTIEEIEKFMTILQNGRETVGA